MSRSSHKSRLHRSQKVLGIPAKALPWAIGGLALVLVVSLILLSLPSVAGVDPNFIPKVTGAPGLEVTQAFYDLGDRPFDVPVKVTYNLQNVGDHQPLRILQTPQVQVLEGC